MLKKNWLRCYQVVTEPELVESSTKLETSLAQGNYIEFCDAKLGHVTDSCKNQLWQFIQARFLTDPSTQYLNLLGINRAGISARQGYIKGKNARIKYAGNICPKLRNGAINAPFSMNFKSFLYYLLSK